MFLGVLITGIPFSLVLGCLLYTSVSALVRQGAAVAEIPGTQSAQGTDAIPEEAGEGSATGEDAASSEGTQPTEESSTSSSTAG